MGRPLKIAKAQAVLTVTDTTATTNVVTVSEDLSTLGVIAGMPFVPGTSTGGLVAGTTYWILTVIDANNFTVSATDLSANTTRTAVTLSTGTTASALTVGFVDAYFNNPEGGAGFPATNANTYGVVGGNTAIYGSQVLPRVAIGVAGTGVLYASTDTEFVTGIGTDLANTLSVGSVVQIASANVNGTTTDYTTLGFANTVPGLTTVAVANTQNTGNIIGTSGNAETLIANGTVRFTANLGGLVAGTVYFVKAIANASAFTVSTTLGGAEVDLSNATGTPDAQQDVVELTANAAVAASGSSFIYADNEAGFILRQKGKQKYLVQGGTSGLIAQCYTANLANAALTPNTMNIVSTDASTTDTYVQSLSDYGSLTFSATSGPVATGDIVLANATPVVATFNTAYAANTYGGQPYPIVTIANS